MPIGTVHAQGAVESRTVQIGPTHRAAVRGSGQPLRMFIRREVIPVNGDVNPNAIPAAGVDLLGEIIALELGLLPMNTMEMYVFESEDVVDTPGFYTELEG